MRHINVGLLYEGVTCCQVTWDWLTIGAKCLIRGWWWEVGWVTMLWWWVHYRIKGSINPWQPVFVRVASLPRWRSRWWRCCRWNQLITSTSLGTTVTARTPVWRNLCRVSVSSPISLISISRLLFFTSSQGPRTFPKTQKTWFYFFFSLESGAQIWEWWG